MSKYRDRRQKIEQQQSKSLDNIYPEASAEAYVAAAAQQRRHRDQLQLLSASTNKLRDSSPRWKAHYAVVSSKWGAIASGQKSPSLWDDIKEQKEKGGYPWTHLSHDQDAEVWINPTALPPDMSRETMRRKDRSIPREWFHLPKGAEPPTVEQLMRDSTPEDEVDFQRAKSPPICGRARSKSRERKPHKRYIDDGGYEPVGKQMAASAAPRVNIKPLHQMMPPSANGNDRNGNLGANPENGGGKLGIPPRKAFTSLPTPPEVNRATKPSSPLTIQPPTKNEDAGGGYEPVGQPLAKKDYEDLEFKGGTATARAPTPTLLYAKVNMDAKAKANEEKERLKATKAQKEQDEKKKKQLEKEEKLRKEKEEKERKQREKMEKEQKQKEEKERKEREKKEKEEREKREKLEKQERERKEKEKKQAEKEKKEREEKERKLKEKAEKDNKAREEKERKEREERAKAEKNEMDRKAKEAKEREEKERRAKEEKEKRDQEERARAQRLESERIDKFREQEMMMAKLDMVPQTCNQDVRDEEEAYREEMERRRREEEERLLEEERQRQDIRLMLMEVEDDAQQERLAEFMDHEEWMPDDMDDRHLQVAQISQLPEPQMPQLPPMSEKERKKVEKALKAQKEKEEKDRKKQEKAFKKEEEKAKKLLAKQEKELEKQRKKEEKLAKEQAEKEKKKLEKEQKQGKKELEKPKEEPIIAANVPSIPMSTDLNEGDDISHADDVERALDEHEVADQFDHFFGNQDHVDEGFPLYPTVNNDHPVIVEPAANERQSRKDKHTKKAKDNGPKFQMPKLPEVQMPKVNVKEKLTSMNESIKNARLPSPQEIKEGYVNSSIHKSFSQPLAVRTRVEQVDVQKQREMMTQRKTPAQLSQMNHPFDIPLPKFKLPEKKPRRPSLEDGGRKLSQDQRDKSRSYGTFPRAWAQQQILTSNRIMLDEAEAKSRQELVKNKTPAQLAEFHSISDIPIPSRVKSLLSPSERKIASLKHRHASNVSLKKNQETWTNRVGQLFSSEGKSLSRSKSETALQPASSWQNQKLVTNVKVEADQDEVGRRRALASSKSPAELAQIKTLTDIPIPSTLQRIVKKKPSTMIKPSQSLSSLPKAKEESSSAAWSLKTSMNAQCLVRSRLEDPEVQASRSALVKNKTVAELSQINTLADFPVPTRLQNIIESGAGTLKRPKTTATVPEEEKEGKNLEHYIPQGLKSQLLVTTKSGQDQDVLRQRQELIRSKSPAQLSELHALSDLPIPTLRSRPTSPKPTTTENRDTLTPTDNAENVKPKKNEGGGESFYNSLPRSLKSEVLVRSRIEDPEVQQLRAEAVKAKSVHELSQIKSFEDIPLPSTIESFVGRTGSRPVERRKKFREKQRSMSSKSLQDKLFPESLTSQQILVVSKFEKPEVLEERRKMVQSRSVSELSQVSNISDIPIPSAIEKYLTTSRGNKLKKSKSGDNVAKKEKDYSSLSPMAIHDSIYSTLPRSMKSELLVKSKKQSAAVGDIEARRRMVQSKSVGELSQVRSLSDLPVPTPIQNMWEAANRRRRGRGGDGDLSIADDGSSQYTSLTGRSSRLAGATGFHDIYSTLPSSMKREVLVRSKIETDYDTLMKRKALTQAKSPAELSQISTLSEIPIPRKIEEWLQNTNRPKSEATRHFRDMSPMKVLPEAMTKQCLVRSKTENPTVLQERQQLIMNNTPHELSKIRNLNELPMPVRRLQLPDIPLPSAKYMFRSPRRVRRVDEACQTVESSFEGFTPVSTPRLLEGTFSEDSEALRFEMSSPESVMLPRDADFGYEVIDGKEKVDIAVQDVEADDDASSVSVADHYRGTPPLKGKKKKTSSSHHHRHEHQQQTHPISDDELPPPLPPKKLLGQREGSLEKSASFHSVSTDDDRIQSRPLPTPPTPRVQRAVPPDEKEDADTTLAVSEKFHSVRSTATTLKDDEKFHSLRSSLTMLVDPHHEETVDETLAESIIDSMHTCVDTLASDEHPVAAAAAQSPDNTLNDQGMASDEENDEFMAEMLPLDKETSAATQ